MSAVLQPGDTYESLDHATCYGCDRHWEKPILCEAVRPGEYHRKVRDLGHWRRAAHAGSSFAVWVRGADSPCPDCSAAAAQLDLFTSEEVA